MRMGLSQRINEIQGLLTDNKKPEDIKQALSVLQQQLLEGDTDGPSSNIRPILPSEPRQPRQEGAKDDEQQEAPLAEETPPPKNEAGGAL